MQIVAPAGSKSGLIASINGGADAVYLGLQNFGARAKAQNFDETMLKEAIELAHFYGVKVFVTLNTLIKDSEMSSAIDIAKLAYSSGADAAIVQDIRYIKKLKQLLPDFMLHASTQMGIHNADGAKRLIDLGISRAVLARETLSQDIEQIKKTGIEVEYFVQGALCVCFSGNCYFSSLASSYSGNRGKCMQLCRKPYYFNGSRGYFLSAKDLCLFDRLDMLRDLGVDAIKIEGRMRSDEYAFTSVSAYKNRSENARYMLKSAFNRGDYCDGYLSDNAPFNVIESKIQGNIGVNVGKITSVSKNVVAVSGFTPHKNDGFKIIRNGAEVCGGVESGGKIVVDGTCKPNDNLHRTFSGELSEKVKAAKRYIDISIDITLKCGEVPQAKVTLPDLSEITVNGDFAIESAKNQAITYDDILRVFQKTSEYMFKPNINIDIMGDLFLPIARLNEFRRNVYRTAKQAILDGYKIKRSDLPYIGFNYNQFDGSGIILMVECEKQLNDEILRKVDYVVLNPSDYSNFSVPDINKPILLNLPVTMRGADRDVVLNAINNPKIFGVVSNNLYSLSLTDKPILLGVGHNIIGHCDYPHVTSVEADCNTNGFAYVFGRAGVMTLCHCPYGKCVNCSGKDELTDENGRRFTLRRYKAAHCYWQLLNCVPNYQSKIKNKNMFFDCTTSSCGEIISALNFEYKGDFTRGNMNKGLK
ncbi:MAG: U32 family peptidase [Clostridiales bacterium]|nr:U32 family peptidase [Clostridiales bacterium]